MKFEEVLQAAREGKKVKLKGHDGIYEIKQNRLIYRGVDDECCFSFAGYQPSDLFEIEVIGNIHENGNLLENKDENYNL